MKSLNDLLKAKDIYYWNNGCGELNVPGIKNPGQEDLPPKVAELYKNYWMDEADAYVYIVTCENKYGILLNWIFDSYTMSQKGVTSEEALEILRIIGESCESLLSGDWYLGNNTDPDGHELCCFISNPGEMFKGSAIENCTKYLGVYERFADVAFAKQTRFKNDKRTLTMEAIEKILMDAYGKENCKEGSIICDVLSELSAKA